MMEKHVFKVKGNWEGGLLGVGAIEADDWETVISTPKQLAGVGNGANPEELLIAATANCYLATFGAILSNRKIDFSQIEMTSEGIVSKDGKKLTFEKIIHKPVVTVSNLDEEEKIKQLAERAEKACFISQTLKGNVEVTVEPVLKLNE